jgi:hypothetical protein
MRDEVYNVTAEWLALLHRIRDVSDSVPARKQALLTDFFLSRIGQIPLPSISFRFINRPIIGRYSIVRASYSVVN